MTGNNEVVAGFDDEKNDNLTISLKKADLPRTVFVVLNGFVDTYNSTFFQHRIEKLLDADFVNLIFDCKALNYVSSTGIGSFATFLKLTKVKGGDVVLLNIETKVFEVFQLLGFSQFFNIKTTEKEALEHFQKKPASNIFPKIFECPQCKKKLKALAPGKFRCSECKTVLSIDAQGFVVVG